LAIIVDKEQKKKDIALAAKSIILENGINNLTVAQVAQAAGVGKGTIYEYFKNKNEIVFELVSILMGQYSQKLEQNLQTKSSTKEKIREFSKFFYNEEESELRTLYKEFLSLSLLCNSQDFIEFHIEATNHYYRWFCEVLQEGIDKQELQPEAIALAKGLFAMGDGIFVQNSIAKMQEQTKQDLDKSIDTIFSLLEVKK